MVEENSNLKLRSQHQVSRQAPSLTENEMENDMHHEITSFQGFSYAWKNMNEYYRKG